MRSSIGSCLAAIWAAGTSAAQTPAADLPEFAATRYPVLPALTLDARPEVCAPFVQEIVERFIDRDAFEPTEPSRVYRRGEQGLVEACRAEILPATPAGGTPAPVPTPAFDRFVASARAILDDSLSCPISGEHRAGFNQTVWEIRFRPWALGVDTPSPDVGDAVLLRWSRTGLWQWRSIRELRELRAAAAPDLARMYVDAFGVAPPVAAAWSGAMLVQATASMVRFTEQRAFDYTELDVKLLRGDPETEVAVSLPRRYELFEELPAWGSREPDLFFALEHPNLVQLILDRGAPVDQPNHFGKTALMYAAQFNLHGTARVLLRAGASPNARTVAKPTIACSPFERVGRTALMYAAENADEDMLALLIAAGADPAARDYEDYYIDGVGRPREGVADYLARNTRLSLDDKQRIEQRWQLR